jgi:hypothetical protein
VIDTGQRIARRMQGEDGASLIIALAFLLLFSLILVAILAFAVTSFGAGGDVSARVSSQYAANAAVDTAVQRIRSSSDMQIGRNAAYTGALPCAYQPTDGTASATCTPQQASGAIRPGMDGYPANAILTTGGPGGSGAGTGAIDTTAAAGTNTLTTNGNVYANGSISLGSTKFDDHDNAVTAYGSCSPVAPDPQWVTVKTQCGVTSAANAPQFGDHNDPGYKNQVKGTLPVNPQVTCNGAHPIATFTPGYYNDPKKLMPPPACRQGVYYFPPGVYFFDLSSRRFGDFWNIDGIVVGGMPKGWSPTTNAQPPTPPGPDPTQSVGCDNTQDGVQFILGGDTQIQLVTPTHGTGVSSIELCPMLADPNHIAIYGAPPVPGGGATQQTWTLSSGSFRQSPNSYSVNTDNCAPYSGSSATASWCTLPQPQPTTIPLPPTPAPSPIDGKGATVSCAGGGCSGNNASITFDDFAWDSNSLNIPVDQQIDIPNGLTIDEIDVIVAHKEPGAATTASITLTVNIQGNQNGTCNFTPTTPSTTFSPQTLKRQSSVPNDLTACPILKRLTKTSPNGNDFSSSMTVKYQVSGPASQLANASLDGLQVVLKATPVLDGQNGCVLAPSTCSYFSNAADSLGHAAIWGNVYTPNAYLGLPVGTGTGPLNFATRSNIVFNLGVIVNSLYVSGLPGTDSTGRFRLGDGSGRTVVLCSDPSAVARARALVRVVDSATASPRGFLAVVREWSTATGGCPP